MNLWEGLYRKPVLSEVEVRRRWNAWHPTLRD